MPGTAKNLVFHPIDVRVWFRGNKRASYGALAKWGAHVRAAIANGKESISYAEYSDPASTDTYHSPALGA
jgi:hypothetical protein